jgi:intraflagellar transport protein 56
MPVHSFGHVFAKARLERQKTLVVAGVSLRRLFSSDMRTSHDVSAYAEYFNMKKTASSATNKPPTGGAANKSKMPALEDFLAGSDFTGAVTLLDFQRRTGEGDDRTLEWLAYSAFHNGDYKRAIEAYDELLEKNEKVADERRGADAASGSSVTSPGMLQLFKASCLYHMGLYAEAETAALAGTESALKNRLMLHISHKLGKDSALMNYHGKLSPDRKEDQLSLAALRYLRAHFQEATDIYKRVLLENRDDLALNLFIAL